MNSRYTMASIQILDMKNSLVFFHTYITVLNGKTDCLLHRLIAMQQIKLLYYLWEKPTRNSSTQVKLSAPFELLVFLSLS